MLNAWTFGGCKHLQQPMNNVEECFESVPTRSGI